MESGQHIKGNQGIWEVVGRPFENRDRSSVGLKMVVDDENQLVFFDQYSIKRWVGEGYETIPTSEYLNKTFLQDDGKVVLLSEDQVGVWSQGEMNWVGYHSEHSAECLGARCGPDECIQLSTRQHLRLVEPELSHITLTFQGWTPNFMASGPGQMFALGGNERTIILNGEDISDVTPIWATTHGDPARLSAMVYDGLGGWLAFDRERYRLLRFDGEMWSSLGLDFWSAIRDGGTFTSNHNGTFLLQEMGYVFLIEPGVSP